MIRSERGNAASLCISARLPFVPALSPPRLTGAQFGAFLRFFVFFYWAPGEQVVFFPCVFLKSPSFKSAIKRGGKKCSVIWRSPLRGPDICVSSSASICKALFFPVVIRLLLYNGIKVCWEFPIAVFKKKKKKESGMSFLLVLLQELFALCPVAACLYHAVPKG